MASLNTTVLNHSVMVVKRTRPINRLWNRPVESVKATALDPGSDPKEADTKTTGAKGPEKTTDWCRYEGAYMPIRRCVEHNQPEKLTKSAPVISVESTLKQEQFSGKGNIAIVVNEAKQEDCKDASQPTDHKVETTVPVKPVAQAND